ncbi:hypothetical protein, partial [Paenibacillus odorifer]|uniref:hypothetical protein n=1 Tax=Paenibacillus odorifer TaxID=189426 RepID=UPI001C4DCACB
MGDDEIANFRTLSELLSNHSTPDQKQSTFGGGCHCYVSDRGALISQIHAFFHTVRTQMQLLCHIHSFFLQIQPNKCYA